MSLSAAVLDAMLAAGCTAEQIVAAVKADLAGENAKMDERRAKDAERQRKSRANRAMSHNVTVTQRDACDVTVSNPVALSPSPNENNSNPHPHTHPENNPLREEPLAHVADWVKFLEDGRRKPKAPRNKTPHPLPADWVPVLTEAAQRIVDGWPPGKLEQEAAAFRDHAADKGRTSKDWQAAFRTWINNTTRWKPQNDRSPNTGRQPSASREGDGFTRALDLVDAALAAKRAGDTSWAA